MLNGKDIQVHSILESSLVTWRSMEVKADYAWSSNEEKRNNNPLLLNNIRGRIIGKSNCGKTTLLVNLLLQSKWLDYNHLFVFGKSLHQLEYEIIRKGFEMKLSKEQVANIFKNKKDIKRLGNPIKIIEKYIETRGIAKGYVKVSYFEDCKQIPDPSALKVN